MSSWSKAKCEQLLSRNADVGQHSVKRLKREPARFAFQPVIPDHLDHDQIAIVKEAITGSNVFFTGAGGSGKSVVFRVIADNMKRLHGEANVAVTAPTGVAAVNIGGCTINAFAGIGGGHGTVHQLLKMIERSPHVLTAWKTLKVIMIDEMGMVSGELLRKLEMLARILKKKKEPFGGVQVVACGDVFQLPPVSKHTRSSYFFEVPTWGQLNMKVFTLKTCHRQEGDEGFIDILNQLRVGVVPENFPSFIQQHHVDTKPLVDDANTPTPTRLVCTNAEAYSWNERELEKLDGEVYSFKAEDEWKGESDSRMLREMNGVVPCELKLKRGAQVILLRNVDVVKGLANGSTGVVVGWQKRRSPNCPLVPVVKFENGVTLPIHQEKFTQGRGASVFSRIQFPLKLAWALTIHKCQGMSISRCIINVSKAFEYGQVYVAFSRCRSSDGLWIEGEVPLRMVHAHPKCLEFMNRISSG